MLVTAALTDIRLDWIDGVKGDDVLEKTLPPPATKANLPAGNIGSWRAHLNAIAAVVQQNLTSALILEDDADWDVRIRTQLREFARSSQALTQPLRSSPNSYADPTFPSPASISEMPPDLLERDLPATVTPSKSPYGDNWDLLWLGHCGMTYPDPNDPQVSQESKYQPRGKVVNLNDPTVPEPKYLDFLSKKNDPRVLYPSHTRLVHHVSGAICSLVYAVTQAGARRILTDMGIKSFNAPYDLMLRSFCQGADGRKNPICLTVQPQLFNHHRPVGKTSAWSDITDHGDVFRDKAETEMIRWSARMNIDKLLDGRTDFDDQFPDQET
ncbi:MAG: hypothetical protein MMC33_000604 [Icmadophila ericetorum]|nr:hypothetical protein [Icmadophila ericetorum]